MVRPFAAYVAPSAPLPAPSVTPSVAPIIVSTDTRAPMPSVERESLQASSVPHVVRLAFDCQQSARDAAIKCKVACIVGDSATAERWANVACSLTWQAREYRDASGGDRHAVGYVRGCVEALSIACDAIDRRWPVDAPRVTSALMLATVPRIALWTATRGRSLPSVASLATPARMVTITRIMPQLPAAPTFRALPVKASRARKSRKSAMPASA
jgi:hypothetical protein